MQRPFNMGLRNLGVGVLVALLFGVAQAAQIYYSQSVSGDLAQASSTITSSSVGSDTTSGPTTIAADPSGPEIYSDVDKGGLALGPLAAAPTLDASPLAVTVGDVLPVSSKTDGLFRHQGIGPYVEPVLSDSRSPESLRATAVPEPGVLSLLGLGLASLVLARRRE